MTIQNAISSFSKLPFLFFPSNLGESQGKWPCLCSEIYFRICPKHHTQEELCRMTMYLIQEHLRSAFPCAAPLCSQQGGCLAERGVQSSKASLCYYRHTRLDECCDFLCTGWYLIVCFVSLHYLTVFLGKSLQKWNRFFVLFL